MELYSTLFLYQQKTGHSSGVLMVIQLADGEWTSEPESEDKAHGQIQIRFLLSRLGQVN